VAAVLLSVVGVVLAWALVNTVFALKSARTYYVGEPDHAGIDVEADQAPLCRLRQHGLHRRDLIRGL
jgi:uncharacterized membrane protein